MQVHAAGVDRMEQVGRELVPAHVKAEGVEFFLECAVSLEQEEERRRTLVADRTLSR